MNFQVRQYSFQLTSKNWEEENNKWILIIIFFRDENDDFFSFDWDKEFSSERKLKLKNGTEAHFIVNKNLRTKKKHKICLSIFIKIFKEITNAYSENTDQLDQMSFTLYIQPALHLTNLLPIDIQCSIDVNLKTKKNSFSKFLFFRILNKLI